MQDEDQRTKNLTQSQIEWILNETKMRTIIQKLMSPTIER